MDTCLRSITVKLVGTANSCKIRVEIKRSQAQTKIEKGKKTTILSKRKSSHTNMIMLKTIARLGSNNNDFLPIELDITTIYKEYYWYESRLDRRKLSMFNRGSCHCY